MNRFAVLSAVGCLALPLAAFGGTAAPAARLRFAIPPQALSTALVAFGKQANLQVLTAGEVVAALRSDGVEGDYAPADALRRLLHGTGLAYAFVDAGTVVVKAPAQAAVPTRMPAPSGARLLAPVTATGLVDADGYMVDIGRGATRTETDLLDLPESVSEVPHGLLDSQQASTVAEAVRNVAGVQYEAGADSLGLFSVRGFQVGNGMLDGLPYSTASYGGLPPLIGIERVEVLKGPQAIIGDASVSNNFGGLINLVLKKPGNTPVHQLSFALGQYGDSQLGLDLGGPLSGSGRWSYRLIASGEYSDRTRQGRRGRRDGYLAPSIGWRDADNHLVVSIQRFVQHQPVPDYAVMLGGTLSSATPPGLMTGNPGDHSLFRSTRLSYAFEHRFGPVWTFRSRGQYVRQEASVQLWNLLDFSSAGDALPLAEHYRYGDAFYTVQNDAVARFDTGFAHHVAVLGFDYSRSLSGSVDDVFGSIAAASYNLYASPPLPAVGSVIAPGSSVDLHYPGDPWSTDHALFLQDQIALGARWDALLALRRSTYELSTVDAAGNPVTQHKSQWVPNAGLLYKLAPVASLYASATSGFQPDQVLGKDGQPLLPSRSRQLEAGAKFNLFRGHALLTVSAYRIMLDHSLDLSSAKPPYFGLPGPGQSNHGVELEFNGRLAPGFDLSAAYTHAEVRNHDGSAATGVPQQGFNLWASYRIRGGALRGWGVAGGVLARSATRGQLSDGSAYFAIPGQARVDANVSYHAARWSATLGVRNVFDRNLHAADFDETFVPLERGRSVLLTGDWDF